MKAKKSLQKFTETEVKINKVLSLEIIRPDDIKPLSPDELKYLSKVLTEKFNGSKGEERDKFYATKNR